MKPPLRPLAADPHSCGVDQHDVARRVALLGDDRRPQPGVAAADDAQVADLGAHERGVGVGLVDVVVPVRVLVGVGDRVEVDAGRSRLGSMDMVLTWTGGPPGVGGVRPECTVGTAMDLGIAGRTSGGRSGVERARARSRRGRWRTRASRWRSAVAIVAASRRRRRRSDTAAIAARRRRRRRRTARRRSSPAATEALGGVDILVHQRRWSAGRQLRVDADVDAYPAALELNLMSVVAMCKAAVPAMQAQRWGRVVAITSLSVRQPMAQPDPVEHRPGRCDGVPQDARARGRRRRGDRQQRAARPAPDAAPSPQVYGDALPDRPLGDPADFGQVVAFLCSEQARFTPACSCTSTAATTPVCCRQLVVA